MADTSSSSTPPQVFAPPAKCSRTSPDRWWLLALLAYTAGTLAWLGHVETSAPAEKAPGADSPRAPFARLTSDNSRSMRAKPTPDNPLQVVFQIPFAPDTLSRTAQYRFQLSPIPDTKHCTVQIVAECDHHFSYAHVYPDSDWSSAGFAFVAPLTGKEAAAYWKPIDHPGQWADWERCGLRRLQVKVFAKSTLRNHVELRYKAVPPIMSAVGNLLWTHTTADPVSLGERFELAFDLTGWDGNPFDYTVLPVTLEISPPDGRRQRILPFFHQNFEAISGPEPERIQPCGPKHFLARYRPGTTGAHSYRLLFRDAAGREHALHTGTFRVTEGTAPDFLRVSTRSPRFFEHADGRFFYAVGWNIPYPVDRPYGQEYTPYLPDTKSLTFNLKLLDDLADANGNFARFWMSYWWNGLEWNKDVDNYGGIGRYNLKNAWINDQILVHCEKRGIYLQLETLNHVSLNPEYGWPKHPYNVANGGFLDETRTFWQHPKTKALSRNHLTYVIARYADSPAIHSWNVMSEPDILGRDRWPLAKQYILSQLRLIRQLDPYGHITCNQLCMSDRDTSFFHEKEVQFVNANAYAGGIADLPDDQIEAIQSYAERYFNHGRPMLVAEYGGHYAGDPAFKMRRDTLGGLWSGMTAGLAGTPLSWWWNFNYGEDLGHWYRVIADFMQGEDLIGEDTPDKGGWQKREVTCTSQSGNLRAQMAGNSSRRFLFLYNFDTLRRTRSVATRCAENRVMFGDLTPGNYVAEYWDLHTGRTALRAELSVGDDGRGELSPPEFTEGWAIKIRLPDSATNQAPAIAPQASRLPTTLSPPLPPPPRTATHETAADWSWRILPRTSIVFPAAAEQAVMDVRIGLPDVCRGRSPRITNADGQPVPCEWQFLGDGTGWRILVHATAATGDVTVVADAADAALTPIPINENSWGLQVMVAPGTSPTLATAPLFAEQFLSRPEKRQARMDVINQMENPLGEARQFLAIYQGPLLAPADGDYVFASNSDDGSFVKVDGQVVVSSPGRHDMDVLNRPAENTWQHQGTLHLRQGVHWIEYFHQQNAGACLARLGWRPPQKKPKEMDLLAHPFPEETPAAPIHMTPEWALDGRLPCAVEIQYKGQVACTLAPGIGLELRRPRTRIAVATREQSGTRQVEFFRGEGLQWMQAEDRQVPIWAWNAAYREFSLEWEARINRTNPPALQTLAYDIHLPLTVQIGSRPPATQAHAARRWITWPLSPTDQHTAFTISLGPVPLLRETLGSWPCLPDVWARVPPKPVALERLVEVGLTKPVAPLAGSRLAPWWCGTAPKDLTPDWLRLDPWTDDPESLAKALGKATKGTGVLLRLDRRASLLGLRPEQLYQRLHALLHVIREAGAEPVLVLNPEIDLAIPAQQDLALAFHRLSNEFGCPLIDLREF